MKRSVARRELGGGSAEKLLRSHDRIPEQLIGKRRFRL